MLVKPASNRLVDKKISFIHTALHPHNEFAFGQPNDELCFLLHDRSRAVEVAVLTSVSGVSRIAHAHEVWRKNMYMLECLNDKLFITGSYFGVRKKVIKYVEVSAPADTLY